jgi:hypothetical protein
MHFVKSSLFCSLPRARKIENPEENADKTEYIMLELYMDPSNLASKFASHFIIFKDGIAVLGEVAHGLP